MERYRAYRELIPIEKIYVHIDQTGYYPGEEMYFAVHTLNGMTNRYDSALSVTAYLEIINQDDSIVIRKPVRLDGGKSYGILNLDSLKPNAPYRLRAYTTWMKNFGPLGFFEQPFAIVTPDMKGVLSVDPIVAKTEYTSDHLTMLTSNPEWFQLQYDHGDQSNSMQKLLMVVEGQQHIAYSAIMTVEDGASAAAIKKTKLPLGYIRVSVLNRHLDVMDQLLLYNDHESVNYQLNELIQLSGKRTSHSFQLILKDEHGAPINGSFSVALRHKVEDGVSRFSMRRFLGSVYQNRNRQGTSPEVNWLDLSQQFELKDLDTFHYMERTMALGGLALKPNGKPKNAVDIKMFVNAKVPFYAESQTDNKGLFVMDEIYFEDEADIILSEANNRLMKFDIYPLWPEPAPVSSYPLSVKIVPHSLTKTTDFSIKVDEMYKLQADDIILEEVEIKAHQERYNIRKGVARLYGRSEITIDREDVNFNSGLYASAFQILAGRVSSYIPPPRGGAGGMFVRAGGQSSTGPLCLLNGVPTTCESLALIPVQLISSIDASPKATTIFGGRGANGFIAVYTFAAEPNKTFQRETNPSAHTFSVEGYHPQDLPEMPDYDTKQPEHMVPDYRRTLFWNPGLPTDDSGTMNFTFFMNDLPDLDYVIEVEGVDKNGRFVSLQVPLYPKDTE